MHVVADLERIRGSSPSNAPRSAQDPEIPGRLAPADGDDEMVLTGIIQLVAEFQRADLPIHKCGFCCVRSLHNLHFFGKCHSTVI